MRAGNLKKRVIQNDPIHKSKMVTRLVNTVMMHGKKTIAESTVYSAIDMLAEDKKEGLRMFEQAIKNIMPQQEVRSRRVGGATYQVPMPLKHDRAEALAVRWIIRAARAKKGKPIQAKLYEELKNAYDGVGDAIRKRDETHKMADANKAFSHFAKFN
jgi:small subunit ribosomal protein S7